MEQIILWTAPPWSEESYRGLYGARDSMDCSELRSKEFCGLPKTMEKIILWTAPPWSEGNYGILRATL
jgi:hypothetical protein